MEHVKLVLITNRKEKFNFNKCSFCTEKILGFIVGKNRVEGDKKKIKVIRDLLHQKVQVKLEVFMSELDSI